VFVLKSVLSSFAFSSQSAMAETVPVVNVAFNTVRIARAKEMAERKARRAEEKKKGYRPLYVLFCLS